MISLNAAVAYHAGMQPGRVAVIYGEERISYADLAQRAARIAALLAAQGIGRGDIVALLMKNSAAFIDIALGVSQAGAILLPVNFRLAAEEVAYILGHAGARLLFVDEELRAVAAESGTKVTIIALDPLAQCDSRRLVGPGTPAATPVEPALQPQDLMRLMYTSGTTDRPKGVMHTYDNYYWKCLDHIVALQLSADDRLLVAGPLYHVGAFDLPGMAVLVVGGSLVVLRDFDSDTALDRIDREQVTGSWLAPVMLGRLLASGCAGRDTRSVRWVIGGGERTPEQRIHEFSGLFPQARYVDAYGLTESCSGDTMMPAGAEIAKIGSTGRALCHVELRICDDAGSALPAGTDGEICLRGPKITAGYWRDPEKTLAAFFGSWFRTGDVGHLDADGFLFLTDRKKDMIISGGENIASSEVERVLYDLPQVAEVAVIGLPDPQWGERVVAVVVLKEAATLTRPELDLHCRSRLAGFKRPRELFVREALPRNPSGKILKRVLREQLVRIEASGDHEVR